MLQRMLLKEANPLFLTDIHEYTTSKSMSGVGRYDIPNSKEVQHPIIGKGLISNLSIGISRNLVKVTYNKQKRWRTSANHLNNKNCLVQLLWKNFIKVTILVLAAELPTGCTMVINTTHKQFLSGNKSVEVDIFPIYLKPHFNNTTSSVNNNLKIEPIDHTNQRFNSNIKNIFHPIFHAESSNTSLLVLEKSMKNLNKLNQSALFNTIYPNITALLQQFDNVDVAIQQAILAQNRNTRARSRAARSAEDPPFQPRSTCPVSLDEPKEIGNFVRSLDIATSDPPLLGNSNGDNTTRCPDMTLCQQTLLVIQESLKECKENSKRLNNAVEFSNADFRKLKKTFEDENLKWQREVDGIARSNCQKLKLEITRMQTEMQNLKKERSEALGRVEQMRHELRENKIFLCISEIDSNEIKSAVNIFNELNDNDLMNRIVKQAYKSAHSIEKISLFVTNLQMLSLHCIGYINLFNEIKLNNHLRSPEILILSHWVNVSTSSNDLTRLVEVKPCFDKLKTDIVLLTHEVIDTWARKINYNEDYEQMIVFSRNHEYYFNNYLNHLIQIAYSKNLLNFRKVLSLIYYPSKSEGKWKMGYSTLFHEMEKNLDLDSPEILELAYLNRHASLMRSFPFDIRKLFRNSHVAIETCCTLYSTRVNGNLKIYTDVKYTLYGSYYGNIYTYPIDNYNSFNQVWQMYIKDNGRYFQFVNKQNNLALYADDEGHVYSDYLNTNDPRQYWRLTPISEGYYFTFENRVNGRMLHTGDFQYCHSSYTSKCSTVITTSVSRKRENKLLWVIEPIS